MDVDWQCHDLSRTFPAGAYDLVCAQYLHTPVEVPGERACERTIGHSACARRRPSAARECGEREAILRRATAAVAPGGLLLVIGHERHERHPDVHLPSTGEVLTGLDLDPVEWRVELEDVVERAVTDPDGRPATRRDNVLRVRRTS